MAGTIKIPKNIPTPRQDAERLRKAFEGLGTEEEGIIWILGRRNPTQIREIKETYENLYDETLIARLTSELSGDFRDAVILWTYDPAERDARLAKQALKSHRRGIKHLQVLVEISCAQPSQHLVAVRETYCSLYETSLEEDISSVVTALPVRKLLVGLVSSFRCNKEDVNMDVANSEAAMLNEAIKAKRLDDDLLIYILGTRNPHQLRLTFDCYEDNFGKSIEQDIQSSGKGDLVSLLNIVVWCIANPARHFAQVIRTSILGLGTDEDSLNRAIITRADIDMAAVRAEYPAMFKTTVESDVIGDTSGDYKDFLLTLLGVRF